MRKIRYMTLFPTNIFILKANNGYLLIDTSYPKKYELFLRKIHKLDIELCEIKYLLVTHYHYDHTGFAAHLIKDSGAKLILHKTRYH